MARELPIRRWVELDEHTGVLVILTQRPPKGLVYNIEAGRVLVPA